MSTRRVDPLPRCNRTSPAARRRGVTVLVVMLLIAITLGLSYAMVRSQTTALQIQQNATVRVSARRAALTGLTVALKKMHAGQWCNGDGVNTTLSGSISEHESYWVTYAAGDPSLLVQDPDYAYRVTVLSVGTATDPVDPARTSTHRARAVVRLAPRSVASGPADWPTMQQYTVYQSKKEPFEIDIPCRIEGPVRVQGKLKTARHYPTSDPWWCYLDDLNDMRWNGYPDYRPLKGPVYLPPGEQDAIQLLALSNALSVTTVYKDVAEAGADWVPPGSFSSYQIYPGGPVYEVPRLDWMVENAVLGPDPVANPLGIYQREGTLTIRHNVTIRGTLICRDDLEIEGTNVRFEPVELPALHGSDAPLRLPVATCRKFIVKPGAGGSLTGLLAVFDEFRIDKSSDTTEFPFQGRIITKKFFINERQPWELVNWGGRHEDFKNQLPVVPYFPVWMAQKGYHPLPRLTVKPDATPIDYHWKKPYDPVYVPHPDDDGLRWDLVEWTDSL